MVSGLCLCEDSERRRTKTLAALVSVQWRSFTVLQRYLGVAQDQPIGGAKRSFWSMFPLPRATLLVPVF